MSIRDASAESERGGRGGERGQSQSRRMDVAANQVMNDLDCGLVVRLRAEGLLWLLDEMSISGLEAIVEVDFQPVFFGFRWSDDAGGAPLSHHRIA